MIAGNLINERVAGARRSERLTAVILAVATIVKPSAVIEVRGERQGGKVALLAERAVAGRRESCCTVAVIHGRVGGAAVNVGIVVVVHVVFDFADLALL